MYSEDEYLNLSGIQHFAYCRRQWALIHIGQVWSDNSLTYHGQKIHKRVHDSEIKEVRKSRISLRSLKVSSSELGISGETDLVELIEDEDGAYFSGYGKKYRIVPVEFKNGRGAGNKADQLQLTAQAICLEEMLGCTIHEGYIYYAELHKRERVQLDDRLRTAVRAIVEEMHVLDQKNHIPNVRKKSGCKNCSLFSDCNQALWQKPSAKNYLNEIHGDYL